jgi:hypothetical protein
MDLVVSCIDLDGFGGAESYAVTVSDHLQRLGHEVWLTSPVLGRSAAAARERGLRVVPAAGLPAHADAILSQDAATAYELAASHPDAPQVFVAHSDIFDSHLPPALPGVVQTVVTLYERVDRRIRALATPHRVARLTQPVDVERFRPTRPLPDRARVAVTLGNYVYGARAELLRTACAAAGLELRHVGIHGDGMTPRPEVVLNDADVVFGKARVVLEAMACARAPYVFDHNGGEGWVTGDNRAALAADNFGGVSDPVALDARRLAEDLRAYDPAAALGHRDFVVAHHAATRHAAQLVDVVRAAADDPTTPPADAPLRELARLVRLYGRIDGEAYYLRAENSRLHAEIQRLNERLAAAPEDSP